MKRQIVKKLLDINRQFYQDFADAFDATRGRVQPGVQRILSQIPTESRVLDVGCGNGSVWRALDEGGFAGTFVGLDSSAELLARPLQDAASRKGVSFHVRDLSDPDWDAGLPSGYSTVFGFAVLHHIPGKKLRKQILYKIRGLMAETGDLYLSNWQFRNSQRWQKRVQPWERVGLTEEDVEPNDTLLDWRRGGVGYRYVHHFEETELAMLAEETGFKIAETFYSDGKEGNLAVYQRWTIKP